MTVGGKSFTGQKRNVYPPGRDKWKAEEPIHNNLCKRIVILSSKAWNYVWSVVFFPPFPPLTFSQIKTHGFRIEGTRMFSKTNMRMSKTTSFLHVYSVPLTRVSHVIRAETTLSLIPLSPYLKTIQNIPFSSAARLFVFGERRRSFGRDACRLWARRTLSQYAAARTLRYDVDNDDDDDNDECFWLLYTLCVFVW